MHELGRGGMGVVFCAFDPIIGRQVAIKTISLTDSFAADEQRLLSERLLIEAQAAGALSHPSIVTIHDVGKQDDLVWIAMELVEGGTLDAVITNELNAANRKLIHVFQQIASALDYAHCKGVVHRDVKPSNILVRKDWTAKLTDFGIAKILDNPKATNTGCVLGSGSYMSPEQIQCKSIDGKADQFSMAVTAYQMLMKKRPFEADSLIALSYKIVTEPPPSTGNDDLDCVLQKALAKDPGGRYPSCSSFIDALDRALSPGERQTPQPIFSRLDSIIERSFGQLLEGLFGSPGSQEFLEVYAKVLREIQGKVQTIPGGLRVFPFRRVVIRMATPDPSQTAALEATIRRRGDLFESVRRCLREAGCEPPDPLRVDVHLLGADSSDLAGCGFSLSYYTDPPKPLRCQLCIRRGLAQKTTYDFDKSHINVGRSDEIRDSHGQLLRRNDVVFVDHDEQINLTVSRAHAHVRFDPEALRFRVYDDQSASGTFIYRAERSWRVPGGPDGGAWLESGDEIHFGLAAVIFQTVQVSEEVRGASQPAGPESDDLTK